MSRKVASFVFCDHAMFILYSNVAIKRTVNEQTSPAMEMIMIGQSIDRGIASLEYPLRGYAQKLELQCQVRRGYLGRGACSNFNFQGDIGTRLL